MVSAEKSQAEAPAELGRPRLAEVRVLAPISIVVSTYKEVDSLPRLLRRIEALRKECTAGLELLVMDDRSDDGSVELIERLGLDWVRIVVRDGPRGLSSAVLDGLRMARFPVLVAMDADLSHPPEKIPEMILSLDAGGQMVIGSRDVGGGSTEDGWGLFRLLNSKVTTLLARPLTNARDPMAGFFPLRKADFERARAESHRIQDRTGTHRQVQIERRWRGPDPLRRPVFRPEQAHLQGKLRDLRHLARLDSFKMTHRRARPMSESPSTSPAGNGVIS